MYAEADGEEARASILQEWEQTVSLFPPEVQAELRRGITNPLGE